MTVVQRKPFPPAAAAPPAPVQRASLRGHLLLWVPISAAFTSMVIHYSLLFGKLAAHPFYDDLGYLISGLAMLREFYQSGVPGIIHNVRAYPPHTLFSVFEAFGAFLILGRHDWAPYAANGAIIFALAGFVNWMARGLLLWQRLLLFLFVLTVPISGKAVYEFRPDIASSVCAAMGATMLLISPLAGSRWQHRWSAGALFGLAMLIKTPTFPLTLAMFAVALASASLADSGLNGRRPNRHQIASLWGSALLAAFVVALPAYVWQFRQIIEYILDPLFGKSREIWRTPGNWVVQARFYLDGPGERTMLGSHIYLLAAIVLAGVSFSWALRRYALMARTGGFIAVTLIAYLIPTLMSVKQEFFGTSFDWMLIFAAVYLLIVLFREAPAVVAGSVVAIVLIAGIYIFRFVPPLYLPGAKNLVARQRIVDELFDTLQQQHIEQGQRVYMTSTGFVNGDVFNYLRLKEGLAPLSFAEAPYSDKLADHAALMNMADYVIAGEQGNSEAYSGFVLSGNIQDQTLKMVRSNPDFAQIASFPTATPQRYFVFKRKDWEPVSGLGDVEGPYPQWNLGEVRWGLGPRTILQRDDKSPADYQMLIEAKAAVGGEVMTVLVDDKEIDRHVFVEAGRFDHIELSFHLPAGVHRIELDYSNWDKTAARPYAVLFKTLHVATRR